MRYAYHELGRQPAGATVTVRLTGKAGNVILLDEENFARYRASQGFRYAGGHYHHSPVRLEVPADGVWYLVLDLGGFRGRVRGRVSVEPPERVDDRRTESAAV